MRRQQLPLGFRGRKPEWQAHLVLDEDLRSSYGLLLVGKGQEVTAALVARIRSFLAKGTLSGEVRALVPTACAEKQTAASAGAD